MTPAVTATVVTACALLMLALGVTTSEATPLTVAPGTYATLTVSILPSHTSLVIDGATVTGALTITTSGGSSVLSAGFPAQIKNTVVNGNFRVYADFASGSTLTVEDCTVHGEFIVSSAPFDGVGTMLNATGNTFHQGFELRSPFTNDAQFVLNKNTFYQRLLFTSNFLSGAAASVSNNVFTSQSRCVYYSGGCDFNNTVHTWSGNTMIGSSADAAFRTYSRWGPGGKLVMTGNRLGCPIIPAGAAPVIDTCDAIVTDADLGQFLFDDTNVITGGGVFIRFGGADSLAAPNLVHIKNSIITRRVHIHMADCLLHNTKVEFEGNHITGAVRIQGRNGYLGKGSSLNFIRNTVRDGCFKVNNVTLEDVPLTLDGNDMIHTGQCSAIFGFGINTTAHNAVITFSNNNVSSVNSGAIRFSRDSFDRTSTFNVTNNTITTTQRFAFVYRGAGKLLIAKDNYFNGSVIVRFEEDPRTYMGGDNSSIEIHNSKMERIVIEYRNQTLNNTYVHIKGNDIFGHIIFHGGRTGQWINDEGEEMEEDGGEIGSGSKIIIEDNNLHNIRFRSNFDSTDVTVRNNYFNMTDFYNRVLNAGIWIGRGNFSRGTMLIHHNSILDNNNSAFSMAGSSKFVDGGVLELSENKFDARRELGHVLLVRIDDGGSIRCHASNHMTGDVRITFHGSSSGNNIQLSGHGAGSINHINITMVVADAVITNSIINVTDNVLDGGMRLGSWWGRGAFGSNTQIMLSRNILSGSADHRVYISSSFKADSTLTIRGNTFASGSHLPDYHALWYHGASVLSENTVHLIEDNIISSENHNGVKVAATLKDNAFMHLKGNTFTGSSVSLELTTSMNSSTNAATILVEKNTLPKPLVMQNTGPIVGGNLVLRENTFLSSIGFFSATFSQGSKLSLNNNTFTAAAVNFLNFNFDASSFSATGNTFSGGVPTTAMVWGVGSALNNGASHTYTENTFSGLAGLASSSISYESSTSITTGASVTLKRNTLTSSAASTSGFDFRPSTVDNTAILDLTANDMSTTRTSLVLSDMSVVNIVDNTFKTQFDVNISASMLHPGQTQRIASCNHVADGSLYYVPNHANGFRDTGACPYHTASKTILSPLALTFNEVTSGKKVTLSVACLKDVAYSVVVDVTVELQGATVSVTSTHAQCAVSFPGLKCTIPEIESGSPIAIDISLSAPTYVLGALPVLAVAQGVNTDGVTTLTFYTGGGASGGTLAPGSVVTTAPPSTANAVTSPPANQAAGATALGIFGSSAALICTDPLFFSWLAFGVLVLAGFVVGGWWFKKKEEPNTWLNIPLWRSLLLQHTWASLLIPCHEGCTTNHLVIFMSHHMTIILLVAMLVSFFFTSGNYITLSAAVLSVMTAQGLRPLMQYYFWLFSVRTLTEDLYKTQSTLRMEGGGTRNKRPKNYRCLSGRALIDKMKGCVRHDSGVAEREDRNEMARRRASAAGEQPALYPTKSTAMPEDIQLDDEDEPVNLACNYEDDVVIENTERVQGANLTQSTTMGTNQLSSNNGTMKSDGSGVGAFAMGSTGGTSTMVSDRSAARPFDPSQSYQTNDSAMSDVVAPKGLMMDSSVSKKPPLRTGTMAKLRGEVEWDVEDDTDDNTGDEGEEVEVVNEQKETELGVHARWGSSVNVKGTSQPEDKNVEESENESDLEEASPVKLHSNDQHQYHHHQGQMIPGLPTLKSPEGGSDVGSSDDDSDDQYTDDPIAKEEEELEDQMRAVTIGVSQFSRRGLAITMIYSAVVTIIVYLMLTNLTDANVMCSNTMTALWMAILLDALVVQPLGVILVAIYRWMTSEKYDDEEYEEDEDEEHEEEEMRVQADPESARGATAAATGISTPEKKKKQPKQKKVKNFGLQLWSELHPVDGEVRFRHN